MIKLLPGMPSFVIDPILTKPQTDEIPLNYLDIRESSYKVCPYSALWQNSTTYHSYHRLHDDLYRLVKKVKTAGHIRTYMATRPRNIHIDQGNFQACFGQGNFKLL